MKLMKQRHSTRMFSDKAVEDEKVYEIVTSLKLSPSSCDRQGIYTLGTRSRDDKALLSGLLVGGVGWVHRAPIIILLFANPKAYVEGTSYMPYLDAGVKVAYAYLVAEALGLKACYVNPNVRKEHKEYFVKHFGSDIFCGAMAIGYEAK